MTLFSTVLGKDHVDGFLQHLNSQQPTIRFTMEIEKDNTIPFLDTSVSRDSDGLLTTSVYRNPTHTDQYLAYDSQHPQSVKRGIVKCLYDRAKHLTTKPSVISEEKKRLSSVHFFKRISFFIYTRAHKDNKTNSQQRTYAGI